MTNIYILQTQLKSKLENATYENNEYCYTIDYPAEWENYFYYEGMMFSGLKTGLVMMNRILQINMCILQRCIIINIQKAGFIMPSDYT